MNELKAPKPAVSDRAFCLLLTVYLGAWFHGHTLWWFLRLPWKDLHFIIYLLHSTSVVFQVSCKHLNPKISKISLYLTNLF
jgi:hypothetical protein